MRFLVFIFFTCCLAGSASAEKRVAFLVGNSAYAHTAPLENPVRDVALVADTLRGLDFEVSAHQNLTRNQIGQELSAFLKATKGADVTLFYFAGHGMQFEKQNYLLGTEARLETEFDIESEALELDRIIRLLEGASRAALVFVDACRDNPLSNAFYSNNYSETRAFQTRGLVPVSGVFQGSMITFSASPGQVAFDGERGNSPFALALAKHLPAENTEVLSLMKRVIRDVKAETQDRQVPTVTNDLTAEIFLNLGTGAAGAVLALAQEEALFEAAQEMASLRAWDIYLSRYPNGHFRGLALEARDALQVADLAEAAGVSVSEVSPKVIRGDAASAIETGLGLTREDARAVQAELNTRGYRAGAVDGVFGRQTRKAVADFQAAVGLVSTGVVTAATVDALGIEIATPETSQAAVYSSRNARRYDAAKLAVIETDERLIKAARALTGKEFRYGYYNNTLYIAVLDWSNPSILGAQRMAESAGGSLVTINSAAENRFVAALSLADDRLWRSNPKRTWMFGPAIGLHQLPNSREPAGGWVWFSGQQPSYSKWHPSEPSNHNDNESTAVFFVGMDKFDSYRANPRELLWGDISGGVRSYVIEIE